MARLYELGYSSTTLHSQFLGKCTDPAGSERRNAYSRYLHVCTAGDDRTVFSASLIHFHPLYLQEASVSILGVVRAAPMPHFTLGTMQHFTFLADCIQLILLGYLVRVIRQHIMLMSPGSPMQFPIPNTNLGPVVDHYSLL